jgi:hypothetical protein
MGQLLESLAVLAHEWQADGRPGRAFARKVLSPLRSRMRASEGYQLSDDRVCVILAESDWEDLDRAHAKDGGV